MDNFPVLAHGHLCQHKQMGRDRPGKWQYPLLAAEMTYNK